LNGGSTLPVLEYNHSLGCSVTGGYRYRGQFYPQLDGIYFYGDLCSGRIWGATQQGDGTWVSEELLASGFTITTFGEDEAGEVYLAQYNGGQSALYRIVGGPTPPPTPTATPTPTPRPITLSASGRKVRGFHTVDLSWSPFGTSTNTDVFRNGVRITTTPNDGSYTDSTNNKGRATYTYQVCEAGTATCSNIATVTFGGG
jgi:hypothetical protein